MNPSAGLSGLEQRVLDRWRQLQRPSSTVIVGFSGGGDSLALAAVLGRIATLADLRPTLVYVDHAWRATSAAEQEQAASLAASLRLPFQPYRVPAATGTAHSGVGIEEAARRERYRLLAAAAHAAGTDLIALAHHQDDQAETVLLHLLRGAGLEGAAGMREVRPIAIPWWDEEPSTEVVLWRPFLSEPRSVVRAYLAASGLIPLEDPSNDDLAFRRNLLRAEAMPRLERHVPGAAAALARFAALAADDDEALNAMSAAALAEAVTASGDLRRSRVLAQPRAVQRRMIRRWLQQSSRITLVTAERTDAMLALLARGEPGKRLEIGDHVSAEVTRLGLRIVRSEADG
jgi:tRNA(Ile)-lysidine synthase